MFEKFILKTKLKPKGDQKTAIKSIVEKLNNNAKELVLLGVTGSGKTFTMANVIATLNKPTLIIAPNKTLAAQLYEEIKELFPNNSVSYFVSYYDYYQPEAYLPASDTYIEKDSAINQEIDKLRHLATQALLTRRDVIIIASVSCIYGIGSPSTYYSQSFEVVKNQKIRMTNFIKKLIEINYTNSKDEFSRGSFTVRGDTVDLYPIHEEDIFYRFTFFTDILEDIFFIDSISKEKLKSLNSIKIYPSSHFSTPREILKESIVKIQEELKDRIIFFKNNMKLKEANRLESRVLYDIEMIEELGYCKGIENYSRYLTQREEGKPPPTLLEYFPSDFLVFIDESHITIPQLGGMYKGDRSRKQTLVDFGFRLPSALDNRPLNFTEFSKSINQVVYVSATPGKFELEKGQLIEQIIRPTGLIDPEIMIKKSRYQVDDLYLEINTRIKNNERVLITTLTKKTAEDLSSYFINLGIKTSYLHADIKTLERVDIIKKLREGVFDVLIGINLLREGLDIPEVSLVAILDADKEGFLRSSKSLIQIIGRAARNINGKVIMYADTITSSIEIALSETNRRRELQLKYNKENNIIPKSIIKTHKNTLAQLLKPKAKDKIKLPSFKTVEELDNLISEYSLKMKDHASKLEFEKATILRDNIAKLKLLRLELG